MNFIHPSCKSNGWDRSHPQRSSIDSKSGTDLEPCQWVRKSLLFSKVLTHKTKTFISCLLVLHQWMVTKSQLTWRGRALYSLDLPAQFSLSSASHHDLHSKEPCVPSPTAQLDTSQSSTRPRRSTPCQLLAPLLSPEGQDQVGLIGSVRCSG